MAFFNCEIFSLSVDQFQALLPIKKEIGMKRKIDDDHKINTENGAQESFHSSIDSKDILYAFLLG